jgi:hypothetical protein
MLLPSIIAHHGEAIRKRVAEMTQTAKVRISNVRRRGGRRDERGTATTGISSSRVFGRDNARVKKERSFKLFIIDRSHRSIVVAFRSFTKKKHKASRRAR